MRVWLENAHFTTVFESFEDKTKTSAVFTARRNARIASAVLAIAIPSVCPSVCHTPVLRQNDGT